MVFRFNVEFLEEAEAFLSGLEIKAREKVLYNIWKARMISDPELFKKLTGEIWEFRTLYKGKQIRLLAFWDKNSASPKVVICTHGFVKKGWKVPQQEIQRVTRIMKEYYKL